MSTCHYWHSLITHTTIKTYFEYFWFFGTWKADSKNQADSLVKFKTFNDTNTWKIYSKSETVDEIWSGLYFCMRDISKGGVKDYENNPEKNNNQKDLIK